MADEGRQVAPIEPGDPGTEPERAHQGLVAAAREIWQDERVEVVAAILLSLATVLSAWGAYQATRWSGVQANSYAASAALRAEANSHGAVASRQLQIDVATYLAWADAAAKGDTRLADFLEARFRTEFKPAFAAWKASGSLDGAGIPNGTPFDLAEYKLAEQTIANDKVAAPDDAAPGRHQDDGLLPELELFGIVADALGHAVQDPLPDLAHAGSVHGDETAREGGNVLQAVAGVRHAAVATVPVAREATAAMGHPPAALHRPEVLGAPVVERRGGGNGHRSQDSHDSQELRHRLSLSARRERGHSWAIATSSFAVSGPATSVSVCDATRARNSREAGTPIFRPLPLAISSSFLSCSGVVTGLRRR